MENKYNHKQIELKWQKKWEKDGIYKDYSKKKKFYALDMFPYPSGAGLHVGHPKGYIATDVYSRFMMLNGYSVLHPMGWDAFGLPAENYAIANKIHPKIAVEKNIATFKGQLKKFGFTYDWDREINTTDSDYYKWTQWIFLKMFEKGLAYESHEPINWCPKCKTGLANEDLENGLCERCSTQVEQKKMRQWVLKMTDYADRLLEDLDKEDLNWEDSIILQQKNWIGRSEGAIIQFSISNSQLSIEVFTTRVDTIYGCTYCVVAPEHEIIEKLKDKIENYSEVEEYIIKAQNKTELERTELQKEKTGVELKGVKAVNPFNNEEVPIFVADYVLGHYGTGAVMAVPAHDERDFEFAKKYNLPIKQSIAIDYKEYNKTIKTFNVLKEIYEAAENKKIKIWLLGGLAIPFYSGIIYREHNDIDMIAKDEKSFGKAIQLFEELGFEKICEKKISNSLTNFVYKKDDIEIDIGPNQGEFGLADDFAEKAKSFLDFKSLVLSHRFIKSFKEYQLKSRKEEKDKIDFMYLSGKVFVDDGVLVNSDKYSGLTSEEARQKMTKWLEKNKLGKKKINYKMRDWVFSRQRYWGEPIPIVHCEKCGAVGVPEKELPVRLPEVESYEPTGTGEGPLASIKEWVNTTCPKCGGSAKRETNTMPQWAGSSWYYLAYILKKNKQTPLPPLYEGGRDMEEWMPVDLYVGGAEHATRHLLYARFWHKFLYDIGAVSTKEPFKRLVHVGLINAEDGRKMSKRWNNVINPDDIIEKFGADSIRLYEMFMGPFTQSIAWSTEGVKGVRRFLEKVCKLRITNYESRSLGITNNKIDNLLHKTIKKVTEDIKNFRFNTAISSMMILVNEMEKEEKLPVTSYQLLITILSPLAPHLAEELWSQLGNKESIFKEKWPEYDENLIKDETIKLVIQVNSKMRDIIEVAAGISENEAKKIALESEKVEKWIGEKEVVKVIFVKGKLVNIVVK